VKAGWPEGAPRSAEEISMRGAWHVVGGSVVALSLGLASQSAVAQCATSIVGFGAGEPGESADMFDLGQSATPVLDTEVVQVSGGIFHTAAVLADGTVVCWGSNAFGSPSGLGRVFGTDVNGAPIASGTIGQRVQYLGAELTGIAEVRGGELHTAARRIDGSIVAWGNNDWGQLNVPADLIATKIDAGSLHTLALTPSGGVVCWGGCAGVPKAAAAGMSDIAAGYEHSLAWDVSGGLLAWGRDDYGQSTVPAVLPATKQAAGGIYSTLALGFDGVVRAWGGNDRGQCGGSNADGSIDISEGTQLRVVRILGQPLDNVVAVSSGGGYHGMALRADGTVVAWGAGSLFNTPQGQTTVPPATAGRAIAIDAGYVHSYIQTTTSTTDCDANGVIDCVELALVDGADADGDGALDACQTIDVPGDFKTIQAAIDSVPVGVARTILVAPGTYAPFSFDGKPITVESTGGAANTTISAAGLSTSAVIFGAGSTIETTLRGFTVLPGAGSIYNPSFPWLRGGGGCFLLNGSGLIEDCVFTGGAGGCGYGGGVWSGNGNVVVRRCTFQSIGVEHFGGAIWVQPGNATTTVPGEADGTRAVIEDCVVRNCSSFNVGGVKLRVDWLDASRNMVGRMVVRRCDFRDNSAAVHARDILVWGVGGEDPNAVARIEDCVFRSPGGVVSTGYNDGSGGGTTEVDGCVIAAVGGAISRAGGALRVANSWFCDGSISVNGAWTDLGGNSATCPPSLDCNDNGVEDFYEIVLGQLADKDGDFIADDCSFVSVPGNYPTIQAAIDSVPADAARTISVAEGVYNESFALNGKNVVVRGAPNGGTILDGTGLTTSIARFSGGEPATAGVENLVFRNGAVGSQIFPKAQFRVGGALYGANSSAFIRNCRFEANTSDFGGAVYVFRSTIAVDGCNFTNNLGRNEGGGLMLYESSGTVSNTTFTANAAAPFGTGAASAFKAVGARTAGGVVRLESCDITGGVGGVGASAVEFFDNAGVGIVGSLVVTDTRIAGNTAGGNSGGLRMIGAQSACVLSGGTEICGNSGRNVSGPFLIDGSATVCDCLADVTLDNAVNGGDLGVVLAAWGAASTDGAGDVNHDGLVNANDLAQVLASWGACP
jgi:alpha-tubulin suppressor-like RCC1 family protein